jgi:hypothetical protein
MVFTKIISTFERNSGVIWITGYRPDGLQILNIIWTCYRVVRTVCRDFPNSVDFLKQTPCWILIDWVSGRYCSDVWTSSMFICKTLQGVRTPSKTRPDGCTGTSGFVLVFAMDTSWVSSRSLWTVSVSMYEDSNLKTDCQISEDWNNQLSYNHYIKCFCFNQNVSNKNTNKLPLWPFWDKNTWLAWKYISGLNTKYNHQIQSKNTLPFCRTVTKGKHSTKLKP